MVSNKTILFVLMLMACFFLLSGCGIFSKSAQKKSSSKKETGKTIDKSIERRLDTSLTIIRGRTEIELFFERPNTPTKSVDDLLDRVTSMKVTKETEETNQSNVVEETIKDIDHSSTIQERIREVDRQVDRDTTIGANIPWWAILLGVIGALGLAFLVLRRFKMV